MKKILPLLLLLLLCSCHYFENKQQTAQKLAKLYLDSTLNDPKSYENIKFTKIDSVYSNYENSSEYLETKAKSDSIETAFNEWKSQNPDFDGYGDLSHERVQYFIKMNKYYSDQNIAMLQKIADKGKIFKPTFIGYKIYNEYRAKNGFGALGLHGTAFILDSNLTKVISIETIQ